LRKNAGFYEKALFGHDVGAGWFASQHSRRWL